jgi:hypothetical protein
MSLRTTRAGRALIAAVLGCAALEGGGAWAAAPTVQFGEDEVSVGGVSPGGRVVVWWLSHGVNGYTRWTSRLADVVVDEDGDGVVTVALDRGVPEQSLWAVVDMASGEYALASPLEGPLREVDPPRGLVGALVGRGHLDEQRQRLEVLVVRPGEDTESGAWSGGLDDGGPGDGDGARDGNARLRLEGLVPIEEGRAGPPPSFRAGDVVVVGNADELVFWARRAGADPPDPGRGEEVTP